jgi:hypothetical protein
VVALGAADGHSKSSIMIAGRLETTVVASVAIYDSVRILGSLAEVLK